jgi:hypothetical protein
MKFSPVIILLTIFNCCCYSNEISPIIKIDTSVRPHTISFRPDEKLNPQRFAIIAGSSSFTLAGSYVYLNHTWWSDGKTTFHFDAGRGFKHMFTLARDGKYAKNLDKAGHFFGGVLTSSLLSKSLEWAGMHSPKQYLWGGIFGVLIQGFIEYKDGFAPRWGFSTYDLMAGSIGSFYPYFQSKSKLLSAIDVKFSYYKRNDYYYSITGKNHLTDDYINQTYWLTFNPHRLNTTSKWPKWLGVSVGFGVDDHLNNYYLRMPNGDKDYGQGGYELFLAPDLDFKEILPKRKWWQRTAKILNFIKVPAPTLRLSKASKLFPIYI